MSVHTHTRWAAIIERHFVVLLMIAASIVSLLNWRSIWQQGITPYFEDFADVIRSGFDPSAAVRRGCPTYPMWGYGWFLAVTQSRIILFLIQNFLGVLALVAFARALRQQQILERGPLLVFRLLLILAVPWYALHSVTWPASPAAALLLTGIVLATAVCAPGPVRWLPLLLSGVSLGLAANFRSDTLPVVVLIALTLLAAGGFQRSVAVRCSMWLLAIIACLAPWSVYTRSVAGRPLLTSTNAGLVNLIAFGYVEDNPWGITVNDNDPVVAGMIREHLGRDVPPVHYEADRVLRQEFVRLVRAAPHVYARRVLRILWLSAVGGAYSGEFFRWIDAQSDVAEKRYAEMRARWHRMQVSELAQRPRDAALVALQLLGRLPTVPIVFASLLLLPLTATWGIRRRNALVCCTVAGIVGTWLLTGLTGLPEPRFANPIYPLHLANLVLGATLITNRIHSRVSGR